MARRTHDVSADRVVFRNGILQSIEVRPEDIAGVRSLGIVKRYRLERCRGDDSAVLGFGGVPLVEVSLRTPSLERHLFVPKARIVRRIFVSTDAPDMLVAALLRLSHDRAGVSGNETARSGHDPAMDNETKVTQTKETTTETRTVKEVEPEPEHHTTTITTTHTEG